MVKNKTNLSMIISRSNWLSIEKLYITPTREIKG